MGTEPTFDKFTLILAGGFSRRDTLRQVIAFAVGTVLYCMPKIRAATAKEAPPTLKDMVNNPNFTCKFLNRVALEVDGNGKRGTVPPVCLAKIRCDGIRQKEGYWQEYMAICGLTENVCPDVRECMRLATGTTRTYSWDSGEMEATTKTTSLDKYGRNCKYATDEPQVVFRDGPVELDRVCVTPIACSTFDVGPSHWVVACPSARVRKTRIRNNTTGKFEDESFTVCPSINDCIKKEFPLQVVRANGEIVH